MNDLITISGVTGYIDDNGTVMLKIEDVATGLGFTEQKLSKNYIMWRRVRTHLVEFGTCAEDDILPDYIPENIFYRLAMKAKNETAEKFQAKVADEILPSIRKHGAYMTPETLEKALLNPDTLIQLATTLKEEQEKRKRLEAETDRQKAVITGLTNEVSLSDKRQILNRVVRKDPAHCQDRWREVYKHFEDAYHINVERRMDNYIRDGGKVKSKLDYVDKRLGMLNELYAIAVKLYETDVEKVKKELFAS